MQFVTAYLKFQKHASKFKRVHFGSFFGFTLRHFRSNFRQERHLSIAYVALKSLIHFWVISVHRPKKDQILDKKWTKSVQKRILEREKIDKNRKKGAISCTDAFRIFQDRF